MNVQHQIDRLIALRAAEWHALEVVSQLAIRVSRAS